VYARILLSEGIGYPLWIPEPSNHYAEYEKEGVNIGDVGILTFDGGFDFLFNVYLPSDHPINNLAPPSFEPLRELQRRDIITTPDIHSAGCVIASRSITRHISDLHVQDPG
jgi:hypothetical protein